MSNTPEDTELRNKLGELLDYRQIDELMHLITLHTQKAYLGHFEYDDWQLGDDNKLRVGDYIYCNHQRPDNGAETDFECQIVKHHVNQVPVVIYNVYPEDPENSGEYADLQSLMMDGWTFTRIAHLTNPTERSE